MLCFHASKDAPSKTPSKSVDRPSLLDGGRERMVVMMNLEYYFLKQSIKLGGVL